MRKPIAKIRLEGNTGIVSLVGGSAATIDKSMIEVIKNSTWYLVNTAFGKSAARFVIGASGQISADFLQNTVMVRHNLKRVFALNGNYLDCRIENLSVSLPRPATQKKPIVNHDSGIPGVEWVKKDRAWGVFFTLSGRRTLFDTFDNVSDAKARLDYLTKFHGVNYD